MALPRYPRPGQPIAPRSLREILEVPIPRRILEGIESRRRLLSELDGSTWQEHTPDTCARLGGAVVRAVSSKVASLPEEIRDRTLPPPPDGVSLEELGLEIRTYNCLKGNGYDHELSRLAELTIEETLNLRGFGAKSLVDLLSVLEGWSANGTNGPPPLQERPEVRFRRILPHLSRFPRPGHRLAPHSLREILDVQAPAPLARAAGKPDLLLSDLDEECWDRFGPDLCAKLARAVVQEVDSSLSSFPPNIRHRLLPVPPVATAELIVEMERRTLNCLEREDFLRNPERMFGHTIGQLIEFRGFGGKSLVDLLTSLEFCCPAEDGSSITHAKDDELVAIAASLRSELESPIRRDDPRFGSILRAIDSGLAELGELLERLETGHYPPARRARMVRPLEELRGRLCEARGKNLVEELTEITSQGATPRNREILELYFGWNGQGTSTLKEIGELHGLTRERVRQICVERTRLLQPTHPYAPILDGVLREVARWIPCREQALESTLRRNGFEPPPRLLDVVTRASDLLGRQPACEIVEFRGSTLAVPPGTGALTQQISRLARRSIENWGASTVSDLAAAFDPAGLGAGEPAPDRKFLLRVLESLPGFRWIDEPGGWFWIEDVPRNRLLHQIEKVLSVAPRIGSRELRAGIARTYKMKGFAPPRDVLLALCRQLPTVSVSGDQVEATPPPSRKRVLSRSESIMVTVLEEQGPVLPRARLEELCTQRGVKRSTFYVRLDYSPVVTRPARGVYALPGREISPEVVESLSLAGRRSRTFVDFGWIDRARIWLGFQVSDSMVSSGVFTIPTALRKHILGDFELLTPDGASLGTLVTRDSGSWGLLPLFSRRGGEVGDSLLLEFNLETRRVTAEIGDERLIESRANTSGSR